MNDLTLCYTSVFVWMTHPAGLNLRKNELAIFSIIYGFTQDDKFKRISINYIESFLGIDKYSILRSLKKLEKSKIIDVKKEKGKSNLYKVDISKITEAVKNTTAYFTNLLKERTAKYKEETTHKVETKKIIREINNETALEIIKERDVKKENPTEEQERMKKQKELRDFINNCDWTYPANTTLLGKYKN